MFVQLSKGLQKYILNQAVRKAGSERRLSTITKIPKASISDYRLEKTNIPLNRFNMLLAFLGHSIKMYKFVLLPENWGRIKGGINCVKLKKANGTLEDNLRKARRKTRGIIEWHRKMRRSNPTQYYTIQYEHFKKISEYKLKTLKGHYVRNKLEQQIADFLTLKGINYSYEELTKGSDNYYFPDFKMGSLIIECTMWRGITKAYSLREKVRDLESAGFQVYVFVPQTLRHFYKPIERYLICSFDDLAAKLSPGSSASS